MNSISEIQTLCENFTITESASEVDGVNILSKVRGQFFFPGGVSRNNRYYSKYLWEKAIANEGIKEKLANRSMIGTISHEVPYDDSTLQEGKFSHVITKMFINEKNEGICEALVLGTPAGKILNTMLRAGVKLFVSSRADGGFKNESYNGIPEVDPDTFMLEGWDWVLNPGFKQASPSLVESLKEEYKYMGWDDKIQTLTEDIPDTSISNKNDNGRKNNMENQALVEKLTSEATEARAKMNEALRENADLKAQNLIILQEKKALEDEVIDVRSVYKKLGIYEGFGEPEDVESAFDAAEEMKDRLDAAMKALSSIEAEFGSAEEIRAALDDAEKLIDGYSSVESEIGSAEEIAKAFDMTDDYMDSVDAQKEDVGDEFEVTEALRKSRRVIEEYRKLGTPKEIKRVFELFKNVSGERKNSKLKESAKRIAEEVKISEAVALNMLQKGMTLKDIKESFAGMDRLKKTTPLEEKVENDSKLDFLTGKATLGSSLMETFSR